MNDETVDPREDEELVKAMAVVMQACGAFVGDLNAHGQIQAAVQVLKDRLGL